MGLTLKKEKKAFNSHASFFDVIKSIPLTEDEAFLREKILSAYATEHSLRVVKILASDSYSTVAKALDQKNNKLILKYCPEEEGFQQELAGLYFLQGSQTAELHDLSLEKNILVTKFYPGSHIAKILNIDKHLAHLAKMHVCGIENISANLEKQKKTPLTYERFQRYYKMCVAKHISTAAEFIIGDHNPRNYLLNRDERIIRVDLGTFELEQPLVLDLYLFIYHTGDVYQYTDHPDDILFAYYKFFVEYSEDKILDVRKHIGKNFEVFKEQTNMLSQYISKDLNDFRQYYNFLKKKFEKKYEKLR